MLLPRFEFTDYIPSELTWAMTGGVSAMNVTDYEFRPYLHDMLGAVTAGSDTASAAITQETMNGGVTANSVPGLLFETPVTLMHFMENGVNVGMQNTVFFEGTINIGSLVGAATGVEFLTPSIYTMSEDGVPQGGVSVDGEALVRENLVFAPTGGVALAGAAPVTEKLPYVPTGGVVMAGVAPVTAILKFTPMGGVTLAGAAPVLAASLAVPTGGVSLAGAATVSTYRAWHAPTGGVDIGGSATAFFVPSYAVTTTENPQADPFPGWSVNVETGAAARYMGLPANSFARFRGRTYVTNAGGVYEIGGDSDAGQPIRSTVELAAMDFGTSFEKRMEVAYFGIHTTGKVRLKVKVKDKDPQYFVLLPTLDSVKGTRVPIGKGLVGRYWGMRLENINGADFELDNAEFLPARGTRHGA